MSGDRFYAPAETIGRAEYSGSVLAIDPSGRGADETAYAVVKMLNGYLYVTEAGGVTGGYSEETLTKLATLAKDNKVNMVLVESNFGDGMFTELLKPYIERAYPVTIEEVRHSKQKEARIIDTLEPVMNQHRLVIDPKVILKDYESVQNLPPEKAQRYMLVYQMTRITRDKGSLAHDDRLDVLAMAVQYWVDQMAADADREIAVMRAEKIQAELDRFVAGFNVSSASKNSTAKWM